MVWWHGSDDSYLVHSFKSLLLSRVVRIRSRSVFITDLIFNIHASGVTETERTGGLQREVPVTKL